MLRPLRELPVLAKINISKTMVTDTGFAALAQIPTLSHVDAEGLGLTDGIGPALRGMARLEHLNLLFTLEISDDIVRQLPTLEHDSWVQFAVQYLRDPCHPARAVRWALLGTRAYRVLIGCLQSDGVVCPIPIFRSRSCRPAGWAA